MTTSPPQPRRALLIDDLAQLAEQLRTAGQPYAICDALEALVGQVIGHRLFTIMRFDAARAEVERVHSSMPSVYPLGGRKKKADTNWADHVLHDMKVFRGTTPDDIRAAFDDHKTILGLGLGSIINIPIVFQGRCLGTMNLCHDAGWYRPDDERTGVLLGTFLIPVLLGATNGQPRRLA
jgi:GAF domain-containing protein